MNLLDMDFAKRMISLCEDGWQQGWHECHGGNLSYRLSSDEAREAAAAFTGAGTWQHLDEQLPCIGGEFFMVTAAGQIFKNTKNEPEKSLGIVEVSKDGKQFRIVWGFAGGGRPTSELASHLANHQVIRERSGDRYRVVYHSHPENIIALSFVLPLTDECFTRNLWRMMPECAMIFPAGIGVVPWMVPGTAEIADITMKKMLEYDIVLWAQHGVFAVGPDADTVFGLVHTVEKAAGIMLKAMSIRGEQLPGPTDAQLREMAAVFRLDLPEKFLYND